MSAARCLSTRPSRPPPLPDGASARSRLWGASFPLTKAALDYTGPTAIAFLRWTISALFLRGLAGVARQAQRPVRGCRVARRMLRRAGGTVAWVALTGITLFYFLGEPCAALHDRDECGGAVEPHLRVHGADRRGGLHERLKRVEWLALAAAFVGSALVSQGAGHLTLGGTGLLGDVMMVVASFFGAVYSIGGKGLSERYPPVGGHDRRGGGRRALPVAAGAASRGSRSPCRRPGVGAHRAAGHRLGRGRQPLWLSLLREMPRLAGRARALPDSPDLRRAFRRSSGRADHAAADRRRRRSCSAAWSWCSAAARRVRTQGETARYLATSLPRLLPLASRGATIVTPT